MNLDEKTHSLGKERSTSSKTITFRHFCVKDLRHSENILAEYTTSIVARVRAEERHSALGWSTWNEHNSARSNYFVS